MSVFGFSLTGSTSPFKNGEPETPHEIFVHTQLLPLTVKLQKETRGRRYREVHAPLQGAILALKSFQAEPWPPASASATTNGHAPVAKPAPSPVVPTKEAPKTETVVEDSKLEETQPKAAEKPDDKDEPVASAEETETNEPDSIEPTKPASDEKEEVDASESSVDEKVAASVEVTHSDAPVTEAGEKSDATTDVATTTTATTTAAEDSQEAAAAQEREAADQALSLIVDDDEEAATVVAAAAKRAQSDDDPETREPVHEAIAKTMEAFAAVLNHPAKVPKACEVALEGIEMVLDKRVYFSGRAGGLDDPSGAGSMTAAEAQKEGARPPPASLLHRLIEAVGRLSETAVESLHTGMLKTFRVIMMSPKCGVHEGSMLTVLRGIFHVFLVTKSPTVSASAKSSLLDMLRLVFSRMEAYDVMARMQQTTAEATSEVMIEKETKMPEKADGAASPQVAAFASQYHADSYALFRALCKLSSKELPADNQDESERKTIFNTQIPTDPLALSSKILSLELILSAVEIGGEAFREGEKFVYLVQHYLCVYLLKNCVSNHTQVAFLSQKIFLTLVYKFKGYLKQEIEVFMSKIFLRVLESPNSSFKQKALVLESLRSLCRDPVLLSQLFLNYDCDFEAMNLYKDMVFMLTKLGGRVTSAPSTSTVSKKDAEQDFELSLAGMEVLVTILKAFLKALGLPGGEEGSDDSAGSHIRGLLQLDSALAAAPQEAKMPDSLHSSFSEEIVLVERPGGGAKQAVEDGTSSSDVAGRIVGAFEMKRNAEQNFELGAIKFKLSLKEGLRYFIDNDFVECDAREMAKFFITNKDKLDKTQMGEALGREPDAAFVKGDGIDAEKGGKGFWFRILHHYVDLLDFNGQLFDEAIRLFLSGFRLPGEAQKIDRIMEKFAEQFTMQNPDVFSSADTAFILAFSVIMLQTDLHNPSIKEEKKMTLDSFLRNNRGIGENGTDLPAEFLTGIFGRIKERPFSLKEDDAERERAGSQQKPTFDTSAFFEGSSLFGTTAEERKREKFKQEREEMMAVTEQLIRKRPGKSKAADASTRLVDSVEPADVVKPMFDVTWGPMIGILSQVLECSDDERSVAVCLNGFVYAVRLAAHSSMSLARDTFVSSLAKFTFLGSLKEMKRKNVDSIRTLLSIAIIDGEYLGESWAPVLQCISQLARLRLTASGLDSDESFLVDGDKPMGDGSGRGLSRRDSASRVTSREAEVNNGRAVLEAVQEVLIDKVFSSSVNLSAQSLAHFIEELIAVSSSEIDGHTKRGITGVESSKSSAPGAAKGDGLSIFSLQKLVEVADFNMDVRPRLVWAQVWELMAGHFAKLACQDNVMVSVFALDSLKQLSFKFLEKPEMPEFHFQRTFLQPFLAVMENPGSREDIRELVLRCLDNIIRTKSHNLRSGWKIIFSILNRSAGDQSAKIEFLGLAILQRMLDEHLDDLFQASEEPLSVDDEELTLQQKRTRNSNADDFVDLCRASFSFVQKEEADSSRPIGSSMRAFCHTAIYADLLAVKRILPPVSGAQTSDPAAQGYTYDNLSEVEALEMILWRPVFEGLAEGVQSTARTSASGVGCLVQRASVLALRAILLRHGELFSTNQLLGIMEQTILPAFQAAAVSDRSAVVKITSESPWISNLDFLVESLPLPPPPDDESLREFAALNTAQNRPLGQAELMLEASFTDLRHGGDGDLRNAHVLAKKAARKDVVEQEQPFPDSWLATTAPTALGLITDVLTEIVIKHGEKGRTMLWPPIARQYELWCIGEENSGDLGFKPCEALVRIACREGTRLPKRLVHLLPELPEAEAKAWPLLLLRLSSSLLAETIRIEDSAREKLLEGRRRASGRPFSRSTSGDVPVETPYGPGRVVKTREDAGSSGDPLSIETVALNFGTLYRSAPLVEEVATNGQSTEMEPYWGESVPVLKIRCVAAHGLHQSLMEMGQFFGLASKDELTTLLQHLRASKKSASKAVGDEDISTAFQATLLEDWGTDGSDLEDDAPQSTARTSLLHGSAMFFLTQEAGATRAVIHLLSILCLSEEAGAWDKRSFAEGPLIEIMREVLDKFLASEEKDGDLIDPNVWRNATESGGKVALYCTSFAPVVVEILKSIRGLRRDQFEKYKQVFFPSLCALVRVHSEEIRVLVRQILETHVAPMLGVTLS